MQIHKYSSYTEFRNALPVIESQPPQNSVFGSEPVNVDDLVIKSIYGGNKEITRDDALLYQYRKKNPISIFETDKQYKTITDASEIPQEFVDGLNNEKITCWDKFRFECALDFNKYGNNINGNLDRLASAYVTTMEHLKSYFHGEELEGYIKELEDRVSEIKDTMADYFAENVGGFLDKNGADNETEKVRTTIIAEFDKKVEQYSNFVKMNSDYANLKNTGDKWLLNDVAYMSQQLRKAFGAEIETEVVSEKSYSLEEISLANSIVKEVNSTRLFKSLGNNEETIGFEAGVLLLKTRLFAENREVSSEFADKMTAAVKNHIDMEIERKNAEMSELHKSPYCNKNAMPIFDKSAIYLVSDKMLSILNETEGDYVETILESIKFARNKSNSKVNEFGVIDRYKRNIYWDRFFDNSDSFSSRYYMAVPGVDKETEFQKLVKSWNEFSFSMSKSENHQLKWSNISVRV